MAVKNIFVPIVVQGVTKTVFHVSVGRLNRGQVGRNSFQAGSRASGGFVEGLCRVFNVIKYSLGQNEIKDGKCWISETRAILALHHRKPEHPQAVNGSYRKWTRPFGSFRLKTEVE